MSVRSSLLLLRTRLVGALVGVLVRVAFLSLARVAHRMMRRRRLLHRGARCRGGDGRVDGEDRHREGERRAESEGCNEFPVH